MGYSRNVGSYNFNNGSKSALNIVLFILLIAALFILLIIVLFILLRIFGAKFMRKSN